MGIFSFLTGSKDEREAEQSVPGAERHTSGAPGAEPQPPEAPSAPHPAPDRAPSPAPGAEPPAPDYAAPFTPPEAWNLDALMAPPPAPSGEQPQIGTPDAAETAALQAPIIEVIKTVYDPEIPVDIYELGLIYDIVVDKSRNVLIKMTLTSPACPSAQQIPSEVRYKVKAVPGVTDAWVEIVWEPPWDKDRMSEAAKMALGMY